MSEVVAFKEPEQKLIQSIDDTTLDHLCRNIISNRFLPVPPQEAVFVGDGDYRAIGAEFLSHFVKMGGLKPDEDVLDIGCGIGRMAVPLTQFLEHENARYFGMDPVASGIEWCNRVIAPVYPNFTFKTMDIQNALYNPSGSIGGRGMRLPCQDASFDFVTMISVTTHLPPEEVEAYCAEVFRILRPGGRLFMTAFIIEKPDILQSDACDARLRGFAKKKGAKSWHLEGENPLAAVAFDDGFIDQTFNDFGLELLTKSFGAWSGQKSNHYQDFLIAQKPRRAS